VLESKRKRSRLEREREREREREKEKKDGRKMRHTRASRETSPNSVFSRFHPDADLSSAFIHRSSAAAGAISGEIKWDALYGSTRFTEWYLFLLNNQSKVSNAPSPRGFPPRVQAFRRFLCRVINSYIRLGTSWRVTQGAQGDIAVARARRAIKSGSNLVPLGKRSFHKIQICENEAHRSRSRSLAK